MRITKARLDRYRKDLDSLGESASRYVEAMFDGLIAEHPGASVAEMREAADEAIQDSLYAFGDQASSLALDLFDEIAEAYGIEADTSIEDVIDLQAMDSKVRYLARNLVDGDFGAFKRDIRDLTKYYVKRCAFENMERNCHRNDLRYARVPSGRETCAFCFMLSSRGFVYRSEQTAGHAHAYHENCDCVIVPGFKGLPADRQVEGYEPEGMLDRWHECQATAGSDSDLRDEWESLSKQDRARYKGDNDAERYRRFVNAKAMREVETRDWRWLYTGDAPHYSAESGAHPDEYERECGRILRENGFPVHFRKTMGSQKGGYKRRTSDTFIKGDPWEMKNPAGNTDKTVKNQMKKAVGKEAGTAQSDRLIISNVRSDRSVEQMVIDVKSLFEDGRFVEISEVLIVGRDGYIVRVKR